MMKNCKDNKYFFANILCVTLLVMHIVYGYVFPTAACLLMTISFVTVYTMRRSWVLYTWVLITIVTYIAIDYITYNPEGISATSYKYMLSTSLAQLYGILLQVACSLYKHRVYSNKIISDIRKVKKIRALLSLFGMYAIPAAIVVVITSIYNCYKQDIIELRVKYLTSGIIALVMIISIHIANYVETLLLVRAIELRCGKEDSKNEVSKEVNNG